MNNKMILAGLSAVALLTVGCEWSGTGSNGWSDSYSEMNFAGTYRTSFVQTSTSTSTSTTQTDSTSKVEEIDHTVQNRKVATVNASAISGALEGHSPIREGSVAIQVKDATWTDNGAGALVCSKSTAYNGTITYASGAWSIKLPDSTYNKAVVWADYTWIESKKTDTTSQTKTDETVTGNFSVTSVTVNHTGQHITMILNGNGHLVTLSGRFTSVNQISQKDIVTGLGATYNAQFEVSGDGYKMTGTLQHVSASQRQLNGTLTKGKAAWDVQGVATGVGSSSSTTFSDDTGSAS